MLFSPSPTVGVLISLPVPPTHKHTVTSVVGDTIVFQGLDIPAGDYTLHMSAEYYFNDFTQDVKIEQSTLIVPAVGPLSAGAEITIPPTSAVFASSISISIGFSSEIFPTCLGA